MATEQKIWERLLGRTCHSTLTTESGYPSFRLVASPQAPIVQASLDKETTSYEPSWWRPLTLTVYFRIILLTVSAAIIAAVEFVYQRSQSLDGIYDVEDSSDVGYVWIYMPVLVMMLLASCFHRVDFNTRIIQPYDTLRKDPASAERSLSVNYLSHITIQTIWEAATKRHFAVVLTSFAMFLAPLLAVVASGLYLPEAVEQFVPTTITVSDTIDLAAVENGTLVAGNQTNGLAALVSQGNLSFPAWTYGRFVFPKLDTQGFIQTHPVAASNKTTVSVVIPGILASLNCTYVENPDLLYLESLTGAALGASIPAPAGCGTECKPANDSSTGSCDTSASDRILPPPFNLTSGKADYVSIYAPGSHGQTIPDHCPQLSLVWGQATSDIGHNISEVQMSTAICSPFVAQQMVNVTFSMPDFTIESVQADESSQQVLLIGSKATLDLAGYFSRWEDGSASLGPLFSAVIDGGRYTTFTNLLGQRNFPRLSQLADDVYGVLYTQWLNQQTRVPASPSAAPAQATVAHPERMRLKQGIVSTRILEGLLGAMMVCAGAAFFFSDSHKLLPSDPCRLAGVASVIADSELLKAIPDGAEWWRKRDVKSRGVFDGYMFSLGWWSGEGVRRFGIDIGQSEPAG